MGFSQLPEQTGDPSGAVLALLAADPPLSANLRTQLLPVDPEGALLKAIEAMDRLLPEAVIGLGPADDGAGLSVERVALNLDDREGGSRPSGRGEPIDAAGPAAYFSTLPVHAMVERMRSGGLSAGVSNGAGTSLCNRLFYAMLHYVALRGQETWFRRRPPAGLVSRIGFIRLPAAHRARSARGAPSPTTDLQDSLRAVRLAIDAVVDFLATIPASPPELSTAGE